MTDGLHERVTENATEASVAVATGANGARVWPEAVKARIVAETFEHPCFVARFLCVSGIVFPVFVHMRFAIVPAFWARAPVTG